MFQLLPFLSYVFVTSFTPGPNNIMAMTNAGSYGFKRTLRFCLGVFAGFAVIMLLSCYFNLLLFNLIPRIKIFMEILGMVYMLYLAVKIYKSKPQEEADTDDKLNSFIAGAGLQFINPKALLYGITVAGNFIIPFYRSSLYLLLFSIFLAFVGFLSTSCWALFGALFQKFLSKYYRQFNIAMALLLVYCALSIINLI